MAEQFGIHELQIVEKWLTDQIETQHRLVMMSDKPAISYRSFVEGDLRIRRAVVHDQLGALQEYETKEAIEKQEARS